MPDDAKAQRTVNAKQLVALIKDANQKKTKLQSISGELGQRIKDATENGHLHRGAFGLMVKLYRMDEDKRNDFLRQLPLYIDICRENNLFGEEHIGDLVDKAEAAPADEAAEAAERNAEALRKGIKPLDEAEQEFDDETSSKPSRRRAGAVGDAPAGTRIQ